MATIVNYTEMHGEMEFNVQARYSAIMNKFVVSSKEEIKIGRGITFDGVIAEFGASAVPNKRAGWFKYYMTPKAWDKFEAENNVVLNILLD